MFRFGPADTRIMFTIRVESMPPLLAAGIRAMVLGHGVVEGAPEADICIRFMARRAVLAQPAKTVVIWGGGDRLPTSEELGVDAVVRLDVAAVELRRVLDELAPRGSAEAPVPIAAITPRERTVLACVATGATSREIGLALGCSERTVEVHRRNLLKKLGVRRSAGLVTTALAQQLLTG